MAAEVGAEYHERILSLDDLLGVPPRDGAAAGRARRRPRLLSALLRLGARAARRRHRRAGRRGRRRALLRVPVVAHAASAAAARTTCRCPAKSLGLAGLRAAGRDAGRPYEYLRRGAAGLPDLLGRRRGVHGDREAPSAVAPAPARARRPHVLGCARADPRAVRGDGVGAVARQLDDVSRPPPAPAGAAADADRQDEHGRVARGARAVPRPPLRRARAVDPDEGEGAARRRVEARA